MRGVVLPSLVLAALAAAPAMAQVATWPPTQAYGQPTVTTGDVHRYEMDRLRTQADQNQAVAQSQALNTQLQLQALQAARQPPLAVPEARRSLTPEEARRRREAAAARGEATGQIDGWLDRKPH